MPNFRFEAYDSSGRLVRGELQAKARESALQELSRRGQVTIEIAEVSAASDTVPWWNRELFAGSEFGTSTLAVLTRELATLINAEIPVDETLRIVALQPLLPESVRSVLRTVLSYVVEGSALSQALARTRKFPEFYVKLIEAGEASGSLSGVMTELAAFLERSADIRQKITSALIYPAVLMAVALLAVITIATVLLPAIMPIFKDAGVTPPIVMRVLSSAQAFVAEYWVLVLVAIALSLFGLRTLFKSDSIVLGWHRLLLRLPVVAKLIEQTETGRFSRSLATMIRNGVPMIDALRIAGGVLANRCYQVALSDVGEDVARGSGLAGPMTRSGMFPELCLRLVAIGEQTGQLDTMLTRVADIYDAGLQRDVDRLTTLLTPMLTIVIGLTVGGLFLSVMSAILSINDLAFR